MKTIIRLAPRAVERVWGGDKISSRLARPSQSSPVGESWEVYGELAVTEGPWTGLSLDHLVERLGAELVGTACNPSEGFPILTKWLDCNDWLSVQVHPDDRLARELTGSPLARGKTECWYFLEAEGEALHGLAPGVDPEEWSRRQGRALIEGLNQVSPKPGDLLFTSAGTVHALGPGLLLYEIQQSSDLTYRLYDWDRPGLDGRPRETHVAQAIRCALEVPPEMAQVSNTGIISRYFAVECRHGEATLELDGSTFEIVMCLAAGQVSTGDGEIAVRSGDSLVVAACAGSYRVRTAGTWLRIWVQGEKSN